MKTKILKNKFLYFFILFSLTIAFTSCSDDEPRTFLEKYDGTTWGDDSIILKFRNNTSNPIETWVLFDNCWYYGSIADDVEIEIVENSQDRLILKLTNESFTERVTIILEGDELKLVDVFEDETTTFYFGKSTVNVNDLLICS